jgi:hypothetical protein
MDATLARARREVLRRESLAEVDDEHSSLYAGVTD